MNSPTISDVEREALLTAAVNQNDAIRQELAHVGNLVSDLARILRVEQANDDGSWPDLAGRIHKILTALSAQKSERDSVIEECAKVAEQYESDGFDTGDDAKFWIGRAIRNLKNEVGDAG